MWSISHWKVLFLYRSKYHKKLQKLVVSKVVPASFMKQSGEVKTMIIEATEIYQVCAWLQMSLNRTKTFAIEGRLFRKTNYDQSSPFKHFNSSTILLRVNFLWVRSLMPNHRSSGSLCKRVLTWRLTTIVHRVHTLPRVNHRVWKRSCPQFSGLCVSYS